MNGDTQQPKTATIALILSQTGEAAVVYDSPEGKRTVVARGPFEGIDLDEPGFRMGTLPLVAMEIAKVWADKEPESSWGAVAVCKALREAPTEVAVMITKRQLAAILEGKEVPRHVG